MKRKTNISVQDNLGTRVSSNMIVGDKYNGYASGDILDANAIIDVIKDVQDNITQLEDSFDTSLGSTDEATAAAIVLLNKKITIVQNTIDKLVSRIEQLENA